MGQIIEDMGRIEDRNNFFVCGTPEEVVDQMQYWVEEADLDGFNVGQFLMPGSLVDFIDLVVPELQRRGLFRTEYTGSTFRERLNGTGSGRLPAEHPGAKFSYRATLAASA